MDLSIETSDIFSRRFIMLVRTLTCKVVIPLKFPTKNAKVTRKNGNMKLFLRYRDILSDHGSWTLVTSETETLLLLLMVNRLWVH